jgi:hypothetical protein
MGSAHTLVEALGLGLPGDRLVVDPDVPAAAVRRALDPRAVFNPGEGLGADGPAR